MRYAIVRIVDGAEDGAERASLLEGARNPHLAHLAQAGAAGALRHSGHTEERDRLQCARGLLGLDPGDPTASPALCYAAEADLTLEPRETAWCCDFMTQQDGQVLDPTAGGIPTKESTELLHAIQEHLGSERRRWIAGMQSHHVFASREATLEGHGLSVASPAQLAGVPWEEGLPPGARGATLRRLVEQGASILEQHPINRVRVDLGENPANLMWLWGPAPAGRAQGFTERTKRSGALVAAQFPLRGLATCLGMDWVKGAETLTEAAIRRLHTSLVRLLKHRDVVYTQLEVGSPDPVERLCAMERLDQLLLKPLTESLSAQGTWRLLVVIDVHPTDAQDGRGAMAFVATGSGLPEHPVVRLTPSCLAESPLHFDRAAALFRWFTGTHGA